MQIGVDHSVNYGNKTVNTTSDTGRIFVAATSVRRNRWSRTELALVDSDYTALGNDPNQSATPPRSRSEPGLVGRRRGAMARRGFRGPWAT